MKSTDKWHSYANSFLRKTYLQYFWRDLILMCRDLKNCSDRRLNVTIVLQQFNCVRRHEWLSFLRERVRRQGFSPFYRDVRESSAFLCSHSCHAQLHACNKATFKCPHSNRAPLWFAPPVPGRSWAKKEGPVIWELHAAAENDARIKMGAITVLRYFICSK